MVLTYCLVLTRARCHLRRSRAGWNFEDANRHYPLLSRQALQARVANLSELVGLGHHQSVDLIGRYAHLDPERQHVEWSVYSRGLLMVCS